MEVAFQAPSVAEQRASVLNLPGFKFTPGATPEEKKYAQELFALIDQNRRMGIEPATVINLLPNAAKVHFESLFRGLVVPPCPLDKPYTMLVIREPRYPAKDNEGSFSPVCFVPMLLAKAFESKYANTGGVFVIRGDGAELEKKFGGNLMNDPAFAEAHAVAKRGMIETGKKAVQEADNEWHTPGRAGARNITDLHRAYCRVLMRERVLAQPKEWLNATRDESQIADPCPSCGSEPKKSAVVCNVCGWVLDPLKAWNIGAITDPQHNSLSRLSRKVLKGLGISEEDIPETIEERDEKLRARARKAAPKPDAEKTE